MKSLREKWSVRINGNKQILIKRAHEREEHVLMKAFMAQLYSGKYHDLKIEVRYNKQHKYKPDVLAIDQFDRALFWGECGSVGNDKIGYLLKHHPDTHFAFAKWESSLEPFLQIIKGHLKPITRRAPVDVIHFPDQSRNKVKNNGELTITWDDVDLYQFEY